MNIHLARKDVQIANIHIKRCSMPLVISEMQIKTIMTYCHTSIGMAKI